MPTNTPSPSENKLRMLGIKTVYGSGAPTTAIGGDMGIPTLYIDTGNGNGYLLTDTDPVIWNSVGDVSFGKNVLSILDASAAPPGSPSTSDAYLLDSTTTINAAWVTAGATYDNRVEWTGSTWLVSTQAQGDIVYVNDVANFYIYDGSDWILLSGATAGLTFTSDSRPPNTSDNTQAVPSLWLDTAANTSYILTDVTGSIATWLKMADNQLGDAQNSVLSIATSTSAPPTEVLGDRYILSSDGAPNAAWDGAAQADIVQFDGATWVALTPTEGTFCEVEDEDTVYMFVTSWVKMFAYTGSTFASDSGNATPDGSGIITFAGTTAQGLDSSATGNTVTYTIADASETQKGTLEIATDAEAVAVTATDKALVPSNMTPLFAEPPAIGGTTPAVGAFTQVNVDNLRLDGNTVSTTDANGDLLLAPNGTGGVAVTTSLTVGNTSKDVDFTINGVSVAGTISAEGLDAAALGGVISHRHSATASFGGHIIGLRSRGSHASPTVVSDDDVLGMFAFAGHDGTDYALGSQISFEVDGTPGANDMPTRMVFLNSPSGSQTPTEFMRYTSDGKVAIGTTTPISDLHVEGEVEFDHTATTTDDHALEIACDAAGFGDVKAIDVVYTTGAIGAGDEEAVMLINIDETASTGGEIVGLEVLATAEGTDTVIALKVGAQVDVLRHEVGTFGNMDSALNIAVDVLAALSSGGAGNISAFVADNDTFTIGDAATFGEMEIVLDTGASGSGIAPTFEYSIGVGTWSTFSPVDGTNGFRNTGIIDWDAADLSGWAVGTGSEYLIRITRTRNSLGTTPIIDLVQIAALTEYKWDKNADLTCNSITPTTDIAVADGGTARSTATAYAVICGGTTATGAHQSIASVGTSGQVLTSNGAAALPTFQATGDVTAAANMTDNTIVRGDGGAKGVQDTGISISDTDVMTSVAGLGIGTTAVPHGSVGNALLALEGTNSSTAGPHAQFTTASDDYPLMQILPWSHDNVNIYFDGYRDSGGQKSSSANGNFRIKKGSDVLQISAETGIAAGSAATFADVWQMTADGFQTLPLQCSFSARLASTVTNVTGDGTFYSMIFDTEIEDRNSDFNLGTSILTAPVAGQYQLNSMLRVVGFLSGHTQEQYRITTSNYTYQMTGPAPDTAKITADSPVLCVAAEMDAADTASLGVSVVGSTKVIDLQGSTDARCMFQGWLLG